MDMLSLYGNIRLRKLHYMRENPVTFRATNTLVEQVATIRVVKMVLMPPLGGIGTSTMVRVLCKNAFDKGTIRLQN